jgi:lysyl-tRNA synthetase class 2
LHNPEFTLLEWYRIDFDLIRLMADIDKLLQGLFMPWRSLQETQRISYQEVFFQFTGLDALAFKRQQYISSARTNNLPEAESLCRNDHALWLDFLFCHLVQPNLGRQALVMIFDYPACLPSLARLNPEDSRISERVEIFLDGVELGNGYYELIDYQEQLARFEAEMDERKARGLPTAVMDMRFLEALKHGLPDCSGIAIGIDRLLMLMMGNDDITKILAFPVGRA